MNALVPPAIGKSCPKNSCDMVKCLVMAVNECKFEQDTATDCYNIDWSLNIFK